MTAVGGNYVSDGTLMAWLATQQDRMYGDLKESMQEGEASAVFQDELTTIKAHLSEANVAKNFKDVDKEVQAFLAKHGDDPQFAGACQALQTMADRIHEDINAHKTYERDKAEYEKENAAWNIKNGDFVAGLGDNPGPAPTAPSPPRSEYSKEDLDTWTRLIDDKIDVVGKNDQMRMIHIQEVKAKIDQGSTLTSTLMAGSNKTLTGIINNYA